MTASANIGLKGFYTLTLRNEKTGEVRAEYEFENLILNSGLDRIGSATADIINGVVLGSATSDPVETQSTMSNVLGSSTALQAASGGGQNLTTAPYYVSEFRTYRVPAGTATGNISQVAIGWGVHASNGTYAGLFSLARVKDSGGNPITITKLSDEVLDVKYTLRFYCPEDTTGTVIIGDQTYNYIARAANFGTWTTSFYGIWGTTNPAVSPPQISTSNLGTVFSQPSNLSNATLSNTNILLPYSNGDYYRDMSIHHGLNNANITIRSYVIRFFYGSGYTGLSPYQFQFNNVVDGTGIPKTATKIMTLNFRISWGRA